VLDAAAIDYEVKEAATEGRIQAMVAEDIRKKRQIAVGKGQAQAQPETEQKTGVVPLKSVSDGIVVLGRIVLAEVLKGYNDGCLQSLDDPEPVVMTEFASDVSTKGEAASSLSTETTGSVESSGVASSIASSTPTTTDAITEKKEADTGSTAATAETVIIPQGEEFFSVPPTGLEPIGYIPFKNLTGFRNFHKKLFALFNSYDCVEYAGGAVMKVAFAETKPLDKDDLEIGRDEEPLFQKYRGPVDIDISDLVLEQTKLYVHERPEPKLAGEDVLDK
jgi:hypothetical protein